MWRLNSFWDWFWYFRRGKIRYRVWDHGDTWKAMAATRDMAIWNCYGSTKEQALEVAKFRMKKALAEEKKQELVVKGDGYAIYLEK